jgi:hypothetical protein
MEPGGSLPHSQEPATCPYPEPAQSSPCPHPTSWRSILILSSHLLLLYSSHLHVNCSDIWHVETPFSCTVCSGKPYSRGVLVSYLSWCYWRSFIKLHRNLMVLTVSSVECILFRNACLSMCRASYSRSTATPWRVVQFDTAYLCQTYGIHGRSEKLI